MNPQGMEQSQPVPKGLGPKKGAPGLSLRVAGPNSPNYSVHAAKNAKEKVDKKFGKGEDSPSHPSAPLILPFENTLAYVFRSSGGKETAINAARLLQDQDERFKRFVYAFDTATTRDKITISLEDLCSAAGLTSGDFLAEIIPALWNRSVDIGKITAAVAHPRVVEATIQQSMSPFGTQEKKMLLENSGFLPTSKGITIDNRHQTLIATKGGSVEISNIPGLPSFEDDGIESSRTIRGDASATSISMPKPKEIEAPIVITAEIIEPEKEPIHV